MQKKVLFYSSVKSKRYFVTPRFYYTDILILRDLGYKVILSNKICDAFCFWKYDLVFAYFYRYSLFVAIIARIFGKPTFFTGGIDQLSVELVGIKEYKLQRRLFKLCHFFSKKCILVSETDKRNVLEFINNSSKLEYSEHTIDVDSYHPDITKKKNSFVTIGWLTMSSIRKKGIDKAIKVFARLKTYPEFKDSYLYIAGIPGDGVDYINNLAKAQGVTEFVRYLGVLSESEKIKLLEDNKYYFQLSAFEGFGIAALEAVCAKDILIHSGRGGLANPIYKHEIIFDIDREIDNESDLLYAKLKDFDSSIVESTYLAVLENYSNSRRKKDLMRIMSI